MAKAIPGERVLGSVSGIRVMDTGQTPYKLIFTDKRVLSAWTREVGGAVEPPFELDEDWLKRTTSEVALEKVKEVSLKKDTLVVKAGMFSSVWVRLPGDNQESIRNFVESTPLASKLKRG